MSAASSHVRPQSSFFLDLSEPLKKQHVRGRKLSPGKRRDQCLVSGRASDLELKIVLVVRQNLKMVQGKITSHCAHSVTGMYAELKQSDRFLLKSWEQCGQPKIVCTCKNQQEMIKLMEAAENISLPTFVVSDAGRTQGFSVSPWKFLSSDLPSVLDTISPTFDF